MFWFSFAKQQLSLNLLGHLKSPHTNLCANTNMYEHLTLATHLQSSYNYLLFVVGHVKSRFYTRFISVVRSKQDFCYLGVLIHPKSQLYLFYHSLCNILHITQFIICDILSLNELFFGKVFGKRNLWRYIKVRKEHTNDGKLVKETTKFFVSSEIVVAGTS